MEELNDSLLYELYVNQRKSPYEISKKFGGYPNGIRRRLRKLNIPMRDKSSAQKNFLEQGGFHPTKGKVRTNEEKDKIGVTVYNSWKNISEQERESRRETSREIWAEIDPVKKKQMRTTAGKALKKASIEGSKLEKEIHERLFNDGIQHIFHYKGIQYGEQLEVDIFLTDDKIVVEIDGPMHYENIFGEDHLNKQKNSDDKKNGILVANGITVIRLINNSKKSSKIRNDLLYKELKETIEWVKEESKKPGYEANIIHLTEE